MEIRKLIPSDADALLALQTRLHDGMAHSEWLADTGVEDISYNNARNYFKFY